MEIEKEDLVMIQKYKDYMERNRENNLKWKIKNPEKYREMTRKSQKKYYENHKAEILENKRQRRANKIKNQQKEETEEIEDPDCLH